jgi:hypothetical protein
MRSVGFRRLIEKIHPHNLEFSPNSSLLGTQRGKIAHRIFEGRQGIRSLAPGAQWSSKPLPIGIRSSKLKRAGVSPSIRASNRLAATRTTRFKAKEMPNDLRQLSL